jgi:hypothetical protein
VTPRLQCGCSCRLSRPRRGGHIKKRGKHHDDEDFQQKRPPQFTGSENWYRHAINRNVFFTDGAQHVAEHGGAYWLLDEIATIQPYNRAVAAEEFQVWKLAVRPDRSATLTCDDGNGKIVFTKEIEHTDFPLDEITLYFVNRVIHLPSEY